MPQGQPNILILMPDQQRADCMGCAGHPVLRTPNMDRLAAEGMRFTHAVTNSPICQPARASFISGQYPHTHNIWRNKGELGPDAPSLFRTLQQCGYYTAHVGHAHYFSDARCEHLREREPYMHARGFDYVHQTTSPSGLGSYARDYYKAKGLVEPYCEDRKRRQEYGRDIAAWPSPLSVEDHLDSYIGRQAVRFIESYKGEKPFCLFVGFLSPHEPWDPPGEYAAMYDPADVPAPIEFGEPEIGPWVPEQARAWQLAGFSKKLTEDQARRVRAAYYGLVSLVDRWFGEILAACGMRGWLDDMLILHWSDHGEQAGDHHRIFKWRFFESSVRVPLVVRWPGRIPAGLTCPALAETVDIMPTLIEAAGGEVPDSCEGKSLLPAFEDPSHNLRDAALSEIDFGRRRNVMVRTARHKYAVQDGGEGNLLYDLTEDPTEHWNLIGHPDHAEVQRQLHGRLFELAGQDVLRDFETY